MRFLESGSTDPYHNLALEQHAFDVLAGEDDIFMLWRNDNAVIVGKHQNTAAEIDAAFVEQKGIRVARRLSGGGAVYHDLGNVNFTFIAGAERAGAFDFASFCRPVLRALAELGVTAEMNGRNDMTIEGRKFSGNAQYRKRGRVMHHGTILYDSDLGVVGRALVVPRDKIASKGLKSVQSRVTNVKPHMREDISVERFMEVLRDSLRREFAWERYALTPQDLAAVERLRREVYDTWDWNYGRSPAYNILKERRIEGVGSIAAHMDVERGTIRNIAFSGDYFSTEDASSLASALRGRRPEAGDISLALEGLDVGLYFHNLDKKALIDLLTR